MTNRSVRAFVSHLKQEYLTEQEKFQYREQLKRANKEARDIVLKKDVTVNPRIVQARKEGKNV